MFGKKKRKKVRIPVSEYEYYLILDSLLSFRDKLTSHRADTQTEWTIPFSQ